MEKSTSILIVEDEIQLAELVQDYLVSQGFSAAIETDGRLACQRIIAEQPDLVLLDLMLPGLDGLSICRQVRAAYQGPIIIVTASQADYDQVSGLELGADDYVIKPVVPRVLLARIRAALRRMQAAGGGDFPNSLMVGDACLDGDARVLRYQNEDLGLTAAEFDLLWVLALNQGDIMSRERLISALRGIGYDGFDRSIDLRLSRLRAKLANHPHLPFVVRTVHGKGYVFAVNK